ncbi:MAG: DUF288 domain-containing protein [Moorea sp. SIOASIH]|uniref:STELLO glycosyltransferase family protein n=1 Tax=Moorena sp. SIOASIH TaxID=2607817 RepID=UPI0013B7AA41|nr:STELLO glycosyltransferase family protein [Moorena sp. SIOASIH]NEO34785.1 DUF288 domain-containing protein [Moorena sp. SIOASIH]
MTKKYIIVTTINDKTEGISHFEQFQDWHIVLVGDCKTPAIDSSANLTFLSVSEQEKLGYELVKHCPYNHYARKNIGYLYGIQAGAEVIYDTDDDNWPTQSWGIYDFYGHRQYVTEQKFVNIYRYFTEKLVWPRGYPLDEIQHQTEHQLLNTEPVSIGVWQGLVDLDPDVDAIYRLIIGENITFAKNSSVFLGKEQYCPFNSQNTFWHRDAFPYLYLPSTTSFRFTDILRGYIAQKLMWNQGIYLGFQPADVYQKRNPHDLMTDFKQEVECYLGVKAIVALLDTLELAENPLENLQVVYTSLAEAGFVTALEVSICQAWLNDLTRILENRDNYYIKEGAA